jgi:hypothetical protein
MPCHAMPCHVSSLGVVGYEMDIYYYCGCGGNVTCNNGRLQCEGLMLLHLILLSERQNQQRSF